MKSNVTISRRSFTLLMTPTVKQTLILWCCEVFRTLANSIEVFSAVDPVISTSSGKKEPSDFRAEVKSSMKKRNRSDPSIYSEGKLL